MQQSNLVELSYASANPSSRAIPQYAGIVKGAKLFKVQARAYRFVGILLAFIIPLALAGWAYVNTNKPPAALMAGLFGLAAGIPVAMLCFDRATILLLNAELALATRDIAQNSFRKSGDLL